MATCNSGTQVASGDGDRLQLGTAEPVLINGQQVDAVLVWARAGR
ncbi:hypothetical protein [Burkholderia sp. IMCC1007]|nr:hypothetical protein [Burkholderia sp. IMCC1007]